MPKRIQRKRMSGWGVPPGAVYVGRPTIWGNPFRVGQPCGVFPEGMGRYGKAETLIPALSLEQALAFYRDALRGFIHPEMYPFGHDWRERFDRRFGGSVYRGDIRRALGGKDLVCWCQLDQPCHADILLEIANPALSRQDEQS